MNKHDEEAWRIVGTIAMLIVIGYSIWHYILADGMALP